MVFVNRCALMCLTAQCLILIAAQGPGPGAKKRSANSDGAFSTQMQSRAVDTRVQLEILEGQPRGSVVGSIPIKPGFTYRFNESPKEFILNETTGEIRTTVILDRESLKNDRFDLVVLSSQPTYPIEVRVLVIDVNDNAPEFPEPSISVLFSENAVSGTKLLLDTATDRDTGINKVTDDYQIVSGNTNDKFRLEVTHNPSGDTSYLYLKTTDKLDREIAAFYQLNISARDGGVPTHFGYLQVNVTILDVNDNPPIFATSDYSSSVNESSPVGTKVLRVFATDDDDGDNAKISYYLAESERRFSVDADTGEIYTAEVLDCPHQNCPQMQQGKRDKSCPKSCVFTVYARDHGSPQQDGRAYVTVNLLDANDHDPVIKFSYFPFAAAVATVDENAANGSLVAAVSVVDPDDGLNGETTVAIKAGNELHHFRMESGQSFDLIRVNGVLDREHINKYNLTVVASDKGTPARTVTSFLIILVNDVNDHEPVFEKSEYSAVLNELAPVGTYVASITATDEDTGVNALIHYSIVSGNEFRWFNMDLETGLITTRAELDREKSGTIELKISAHDGGPNPKWAYTQIKVSILDENDEKPTFTQDTTNISISEDIAENSPLTTVSAIDHDQGTNGSVIYTLHPDTVAKFPSTFTMHPVTGQLVVIRKLDRETIPVYQIKVVAKDQGSPPQSSTATIFLNLLDANDNVPVFYPIWYFARVNDTTAPGTAILTVIATDADLNDKISYKIEASDDEPFYINEITGTLYLKSPLNTQRENSFRLAISATDKEGKKCSGNAAVEIYRNTNDEEFTFENDNYIFQTREDDGLREEYVERELGKVKIKSRNSVYDVQYFIISGDPKHMFEIGERSGVIRTNGKIDRELVPNYSLTVVAKMTSALARTRINITILDLNDNRPQFSNEKDQVDVPENTAVGQEIFLIRAKDKDSGLNSRITYSMDSGSDQFRISSDSGVIYLNKPLKVPPGTELTAEIKATDSGTPALWAKHSLSIIVTDVNDHTPIFEKMSYEISLPESVTVNDRFIPVVAYDEDFGPNGALQYNLISGNKDGKFGIFPDGYVYVKKKLDREEKDYYCLTIEVKDSGNPERSSNVPLIVHVIDENDNKPEFVNSSFSFEVKENEPADTFVGKINAVDKDVGRNAELTFALLGKQIDFIVDPKNGFIRTARTFDREYLVQSTGQNSISLEATVSDNGMPRLHDKVKITIFITDVNDNAPQFLRLPYKVSISESSPLGTQILRVFTTDADEGLNRDVFYFIAAGNEERRFVIDKATGQISVSKHLDREKTSHYELTVTAYDAAAKSLSTNTTISIEITDENDNPPVFQNVISHMSILENAPLNSKLHEFSATDLDSGVNSEIFFSIGSGNRRESFQIDPLSGVLYLRKKLDYEDVTSYVLNITAYDGGNPRLSTTLLFTVTVEDCNDNPPAFPSTAIVRQIRENIPINTPIVTVTAEDPDSGLNGKIIYSIVKQEPAENSISFHFQINPKTGVIHTQLPIDRETVDTFRLTVRATDQAPLESDRLFAEKMVTVIVEDINDNAPTFVSMNAAILKGTSPDMLVMNALAKDPDSGTNGMVTYDLFGSNLDLFYIQRNTGMLAVKKHILETRIKYQLSIRATDEAVQSDRRSSDQYVTIITPGPKNELVFTDDFNGNVYENEPIGTNILTVNARHSHSHYEIEYYITNITGIGGIVENRIFDIDPKLGILSTAVILDRESASEWYEVEVYAIVTNNLMPISGVTKVHIDVLDKNDSPPSFSEMPTEFSVSEDVPIGHVVTTVKVTDPDTPTRITFSLIAGDREKFHLDADTGVLSLTDLLDRETKSKHRLIVQANDGIQKTEATFTITVTDTNDNPPVFSESVYSFDVAENDGRGTKIGQISATDEDENMNGLISYTVISDWANDIFSLNPQTGIFTLTAKLDYEEVQHYVFTVQAQDYGRPVLSSTVTVYFNVIDLNDNPPVFESASYTAELLENVTVGTPVVTVTAKDLDSGDNGRIEYEMVNEDKENDFIIDPKNGTIYSNRMLDRETHSTYGLVVLAKDKAKPPQQRLTATVQVAITIKDVNDMSPEFLISNETSVPENTAVNTVVTVIKAVDKDEGRNSYLEYSLGDSAAGMFTLGSADGLLRVNGKLDREAKANYTLKVKAKDRGEPSRYTEMELLVKVLDENDNSPVFNPKQYSAFVPENASIGVSILQVFANDDDEGLNGRIRYTIVEGDENRDFSVSEDGGILRVAKNLNYERRNKYVLTVKAEDNEGNSDLPIRSDVATVSITITDVNDNFPIFLHSPYYAYVMENTVNQPDGYVLTVKAFDFDSAPFNSQIRYFLKEGDLDLFRINASSGEIFLLAPLDREKQAEYVLSVVAMDAGSPPLTGSGTVHVFVQDVNDHSPQFERSDYVAFVGENLPIGSEVIHIQAVDSDAGLNSKLKYSLLGERFERFQVNSETGLISTNVLLDREDVSVYRLTLVAQDSSVTEPKASTVNLLINVLDENDNAPVFADSQYMVHVADRIQAGEFVCGVIATDADTGENSRIEYSMSGPDVGKFTLNGKTGVIKASKEFRPEDTHGMFKINVQASDNGKPKKTSSIQIVVRLRPAHLFPVIVAPKDNVFVLPENCSPGKVVTKLKASSPKSGTSGVIKFAIAGGNIGDAFKVDANTGEVTVSDGELDYELFTQYEIWIEAQDSDTVPLKSVVSLIVNVTDVNDNAPVFENITYYGAVFEEEFPPQSVLKVKAHDRDSGINGKVAYKLKTDSNGSFAINSKTGEIKTKVKLDREQIDSYQLLVEAYDEGTPSLKSTVPVYISVLDKNDNPPKFTRLFSVNVTENAGPGDFVIQITISDQDIGENANATFSFAENPGNKFAIDPSSGNVTVVGPLDREVEDEYLLKVVVVDGSWRAETPLTITVQDQNDNAPEFENSLYNFYFPESNQNGVFIGQILAQDKDKQGPNSLITYSLTHPSDYFSIDPSSAEIFSKKRLRYKYSMLDSNPENQYGFTVVATDNGKPPLSSVCRVTVNVINANNNAPKFEQKEYFSSVPELAPVGQKILRIRAIDNLDYGINAAIEYTKVDGNDSDIFAVSKSEGWVVLQRSPKGLKHLTKYTLQVRASDHGIPPKHDVAQVTLVICGENNYSPVFSALSYQVIVPENEAIGSTILTIVATDEDEGPNGMIRYSMNKTDLADDKFHVDPVTGAVIISQALDYDQTNEYKLNVMANDLGFVSKTAIATLTVLLADINDNPPVFNRSIFEVYISEKLPAYSPVTQIIATDMDSPKYAIIKYAIAGGTGKELFQIDSNNGTIYSTVKFDYEEKDKYTLEIVATNPDSTMQGSTLINMFITGENEFYPRFVQPVFHYDISESAAIGNYVGTVQATDQDAGDDGIVYYLFVGSSNDKGFAVNSITGSITVSKHLDRETQNRVVLTVMAKNAGSIRGNDTDEAQVIISIQDGNDPPEFYSSLYEAEIAENVEIGTKVIQVKAFDKDVKQQHNQFSYSIINGNFEKAFKIDSQTGEIETSAVLDRETIASYNIVVAAIDTGSPPETGTATVKITVTDVNDNGPVFEPSSPVGYVLENEAPGTTVMTLSARDPDLPPNGAPFKYTVVSGSSQNFFTLDSQSGVITTTQPLDREVTPQIDLMVSVEDSGEPRMKSLHTVKIFIQDQNDSPSTSRSVHIMVHSFNELFPVGKIANVRPNDPDLIGDYKCRLLNDPLSKGILSIPINCDLHASKVVLGSGFAFSVLGNDGKHSDVVSSVTVEFLSFNNHTIDNSLIVRVENMSSVKFLSRYYKEFLDTLRNVSNNGDTPFLFSLYDNDDGLEIALAMRDGDNYRNSEQVRQRLTKKHHVFRQLFQSNVIIGYSPCKNNICENGGACRDEIMVIPETVITDSQALVFTSPLVRHDFVCFCSESYMGKKCEKRQDPCTPNPCQAGGSCRKQGVDFQCQCPAKRKGPLCEEERIDKCDENPCQNGGSCRESPDSSSYFCLCRPGYRGNQCEIIADSCRPNPCLNGGFCTSLKPGYKCNCPEGLHGRHCEKSTFGFGDLSYMTFPGLDLNTNDISVTFATMKSDSLLVYNYGVQTGGRSDFVALELVDGKAVFSYGGTRTAITSIVVPQQAGQNSASNSLADGNWHKITATRNGRVVSLSVALCTENGDSCQECKPGDISCYTDDTGPSGTLNFNNNPLFIGGLSSADAILERPGQVHSDDFVGCIHSISINGRQLNLSNPIKTLGVEPICNRSSQSGCRSYNGNTIDSGNSICGSGTCHDQWKKVSCICDDSGAVAPNCNSALEPVTLIDGGFVEFKISEKHRRLQLLENIYGGSTLWFSRYVSDRSRRQSEERSEKNPKYVGLTFRTIRSNGLLLFFATDKDFTSIEMINGQIIYRSKLGKESPVNMSVDSNGILSDGQWHHLKLQVHQRILRVYIDGEKVGEELDSESVHNFLDPYLTIMSVGGVSKEYITLNDLSITAFSGCVGNFTINGEIQPFGGFGSIYQDVVHHGKVSIGCTGPIVSGAVSNPDPLRIGVSLVVVFFMTLLVAIIVSFMAFRLRKQKKEKPSVGHLKQNGVPNVNNGGVISGAGDVIRTALHNDATVPPYMTDNGDIIRGVGHHMVAPELISKRFKDQEMTAMEQMQRSQRPDIIEREVVGKSPPPREEHHSLPPKAVHHPHDSSHSQGDNDLPEHYDLENSSSIAPSDIDIICHYKSYRDGGNMRKYKLVPPHVPPPAAPLYHKHNIQPRHSPLHSTGFAVHSRENSHSVVRPPPVTRVDSPKQLNLQHQSTPLARLSPSSELSQQMPRILTLQDISGKPLQSALLATTSSSGGVGKDALHTNSERSLNSPVMSQLSGRSSSESRKTAGPPSHDNSADSNVGLSIGLSSQDIGRLSAHPRNSSLVSTLDVVSCSSGRVDNASNSHHHLHHNSADAVDDNHSSTSTDESGNDSFTCSEIEYDNNSVSGEKLTDVILNNLADDDRNRGRSSDRSGSNKPPPLPPYSNFDSSFRGSLSTLVASDDDIAHVPMFRPQNSSPSSIPTSLGWEYLLNWGPNFENFAGVFKDIAELPESVNNRMNGSLRSQNKNKSSEEYV